MTKEARIYRSFRYFVPVGKVTQLLTTAPPSSSLDKKNLIFSFLSFPFLLTLPSFITLPGIIPLLMMRTRVYSILGASALALAPALDFTSA